MKLIQSNLFRTQTIELFESKIHISKKYIGNKNEYDIDYQSIFPNKDEVKTNNLIWFCLCGFFYLLSFAVYYWRFIENDKTVEEEAFVIWLIVGTILLLIALRSSEKYWRINLSNNQFIKIYKKKPNKIEVEKFIEQLFKKRNSHLYNLYGFTNPNLSYESQYNNFLWLKNMEVFTKSDFENKIQELNTIFGKQTNKIGF